MKINAISTAQNNQNFGAIQKLVYTTGGAEKTCLFNLDSKTTGLPKKVGEFIRKPNGDISGVRIFRDGAKISFDTNRTNYRTPCVSYTYSSPKSKSLFHFDLDTFKEHFKELTSQKGIRDYIKKIKEAPKTTTYKPCS
ncbi:hypothetical protein J6Q66_06030 [bacterium]|nr:hypothetical protein [bacterium]